MSVAVQKLFLTVSSQSFIAASFIITFDYICTCKNINIEFFIFLLYLFIMGIPEFFKSPSRLLNESIDYLEIARKKDLAAERLKDHPRTARIHKIVADKYRELAEQARELASIPRIQRLVRPRL